MPAGSVLSCLSIQLLLSDQRKFTPSSKAAEPRDAFSLKACIAACTTPVTCPNTRLAPAREFVPSRHFIVSSFRRFVVEGLALAGRQAVLVLAAIKVGGATAMSIWHSTFYGGIAESDYGIDTQMLGVITSYTAACSERAGPGAGAAMARALSR
eukprot:COSAG04_NODE_5291_length_1671_cov_1.539440_2_plen_153_part_01